jgi:hypothetical protein
MSQERLPPHNGANKAASESNAGPNPSNIDKLPDEMLWMILNDPKLTPKDILRFSQASHRMRNVATKHMVWKRFGAENAEDFKKRTSALPAAYQRSILDGKCFLPDAEIIIRSLNEMTRLAQLDPFPPNVDEQLVACRAALVSIPECQAANKQWDNAYSNLFFLTRNREENQGRLAVFNKVCAGYITIAQIVDTPMLVQEAGGIVALTERLITPEQAGEIKRNHPENYIYTEYLDALFSQNGLNALRNGLIQLNEANAMATPRHLNALLSDRRYLDALRAGRITVEEINQIPIDAAKNKAVIENDIRAALAAKIQPSSGPRP